MNERFTMLSERAAVPVWASRANHKPVVDSCIKMSSADAHLTARAMEVYARALQYFQIEALLQQKEQQIALEQSMRRLKIGGFSGSELAGGSVNLKRTPVKVSADSTNDVSKIAGRRQMWRRGGVTGVPFRRGINNRGGRQGVGWANMGPQRGRRAWQQATPARGQGMRGRGRGGVARQLVKRAVTKEQLDAELDQYMSMTRSALDKDLDTYMSARQTFLF